MPLIRAMLLNNENENDDDDENKNDYYENELFQRRVQKSCNN